MESKIEALNKINEDKIEQIRKFSKGFAIDFFFKKSEEVSHQFTSHVLDILNEQDQLKKESYKNSIQMAHNTYSIIFLERVNTQLK